MNLWLPGRYNQDGQRNSKEWLPFNIVSPRPRCLFPFWSSVWSRAAGVQTPPWPCLRTTLTVATPRHQQPLCLLLNLNPNRKRHQRDWNLKHSDKCRMKVAKRLDLIKTAFYVWARAEMPPSRCHYATQGCEKGAKFFGGTYAASHLWGHKPLLLLKGLENFLELFSNFVASLFNSISKWAIPPSRN